LYTALATGLTEEFADEIVALPGLATRAAKTICGRRSRTELERGLAATTAFQNATSPDARKGVRAAIAEQEITLPRCPRPIRKGQRGVVARA
jgi:hypothetical protein